MYYELKKIKLALKQTWKISRNESLFKTNYILSKNGIASEIAPNTRYKETAERIEKEFLELNQKPEILDEQWCQSFKNAVNNIALKEQGDIFSQLKLANLPKILTSFSIPIMDEKEVKDYLDLNNQFQIYKLKVCNESALGLLKEVTRHTAKPIRIDANEGFHSLEEYLHFEEQIKDFNIEFIEQPFSHTMIEEYKKLKPISRFEIIADESLINDFNGELFSKMFHGINVKLMKAGGITTAAMLLRKAKQLGLKTMIGCMIETSLGISEAYVLASLCDYCDLDGALLIKNDPYQNLFTLEDGFLIPTSTNFS
jgi:L-Ala-D/L-Glu epimerase